MARCPHCRRHFAEPEDEQGQHDCPRCGSMPDREADDQYTDDDDRGDDDNDEDHDHDDL